MSKLITRPRNTPNLDTPGLYEQYDLKENPFPLTPFFDQDSNDEKINGAIYEHNIRKNEKDKFTDSFLKVPQTQEHHRLGYIIDTSYVGRGNGKTAFISDLEKNINHNYCLDISDEHNKCFSVILSPEGGGKTKNFSNFTDLFFNTLIKKGMIDTSLTMLRLEALTKIYPDFPLEQENDNELIKNLNNIDWFKDNDLDIHALHQKILENEFLKNLPSDFPLLKIRSNYDPGIFHREIDSSYLITQETFVEYYKTIQRKISEKLDFVYSNLVRLFLAAGFNGAYIFIDDFERIPDFQSARQKRDFAMELRTYLFDGISENAKTGFYNFILVCHAGVPGLIQEAWATSGLESRVGISSELDSDYMIQFEKLDIQDAKLLLLKYLKQYRISDEIKENDISPFDQNAFEELVSISELNAAKILKNAHILLEKAARGGEDKIDKKFINDQKNLLGGQREDSSSSEEKATVSLQEKE